MKNKEITQEIIIPAEFKHSKTPQKAGAARKKKKQSKKKSKSPFISALLKLGFLVFGILLIAFLVMKAFGSVTFINVTSGFGSFMEQFSPGDGFPYKMESNSVKNVSISGSKLIILSNDSSIVFNSTAKKVFTAQHTYADPSLKVKNGRTIVFDRGSGRFRVQTASKILFEKTMENDILNAALGKKGNCAVATKSDSVASTLTVFDRHQQEVFVWNCSNEYISGISLSNNGKSAAVTVVGSKNAEVYSRLLIFDFDSDKPVASFDFESTTLFNVIYHSNGRITAVGDNRRVVIEGRKKIAENLSLGTDSYTSFYEYESGKTVLVRSDFGRSINKLSVYDSKGRLMFEKDIDKVPVSIACDSSYVVVLFKNELIFLGGDGDIIKKTEVSCSDSRVVTYDGTAYIISNGLIEQYKISLREQQSQVN
jgi:hypothetical protein